MPTPFALETRRGTPSYCGGWGPATAPWHRLRDAAGRLATRATKRMMQRVLAGAFREAGTGVYRADGSEAAYSPTAILGLGMTELELERDWPGHFRMIGPVTATPAALPPDQRRHHPGQPDPRVHDETLQGDPVPADVRRVPDLPPGPLVLVTVGTHLAWARRDLVAQVRTLAESLPSHTFVVTLGQRGAERPAGGEATSTDRVVVVDHLPYDEVMPAFDAVVHHGGAGITYSAVRAGVPALVHPRDYDQFDFAARIVAAGAGLRTRRDLDHPAAALALREVLAMDRTRLRALALASARYDPISALADVVDDLTSRDRDGLRASHVMPRPGRRSRCGRVAPPRAG